VAPSSISRSLTELEQWAARRHSGHQHAHYTTPGSFVDSSTASRPSFRRVASNSGIPAPGEPLREKLVGLPRADGRASGRQAVARYVDQACLAGRAPLSPPSRRARGPLLLGCHASPSPPRNGDPTAEPSPSVSRSRSGCGINLHYVDQQTYVSAERVPPDSSRIGGSVPDGRPAAEAGRAVIELKRASRSVWKGRNAVVALDGIDLFVDPRDLSDPWPSGSGRAPSPVASTCLSAPPPERWSSTVSSSPVAASLNCESRVGPSHRLSASSLLRRRRPPRNVSLPLEFLR